MRRRKMRKRRGLLTAVVTKIGSCMDRQQRPWLNENAKALSPQVYACLDTYVFQDDHALASVSGTVATGIMAAMKSRGTAT